MAGVTALGATFSFAGFAGSVTGISVESPTAQITDMTPMGASIGYIMMVPTGDWAGGTVTVDFVSTGQDLQAVVRKPGRLVFSSPAFSIGRNVICESASVTAQLGDVVRGSLKFLITDYTGT
jgi:hypothetical protein